MGGETCRFVGRWSDLLGDRERAPCLFPRLCRHADCNEDGTCSIAATASFAGHCRRARALCDGCIALEIDVYELVEVARRALSRCLCRFHAADVHLPGRGAVEWLADPNGPSQPCCPHRRDDKPAPPLLHFQTVGIGSLSF